MSKVPLSPEDTAQLRLDALLHFVLSQLVEPVLNAIVLSALPKFAPNTVIVCCVPILLNGSELESRGSS
jgi:hypothetical protein